VHLAHYGFSTIVALHKFSYLLTYLLRYLTSKLLNDTKCRAFPLRHPNLLVTRNTSVAVTPTTLLLICSFQFKSAFYPQSAIDVKGFPNFTVIFKPTGTLNFDLQSWPSNMTEIKSSRTSMKLSRSKVVSF